MTMKKIANLMILLNGLKLRDDELEDGLYERFLEYLRK